MTISEVSKYALRRDGVTPDRSMMRVVHLARSIYRLAGRKITIMFLAMIPSGLVLGALEIVIAFAFYLVLARFNLVTLTEAPVWLPEGLNPIILLILMMVIGTVLRYATQILPNIANSAFFARVREALVDATLNRPGEGAALSVAEVSYLWETVSGKAGGFIQAVASIFSMASLIALVAAQLFILSWKLTLIAFVAAAAIGLPILVLKPLCGRFADRQYRLFQAATYRLLKDVRNAHFLKVCGLSGLESTELGRMARTTHALSVTYALLNGITVNAPALAGALIILGLLWMNEVWSLMSAGTLVPFIYLLNRAIGSLATLSSGHSLARECLPYMIELARYDRMFFPDRVEEPEEGGVTTERIQVLDVRKLTFGRNVPLTPPLSFSVRRGEMVLISGPSGRGKTTLLMTFLGMVPPLGGTVEWNGTDLLSLDQVDLRRKIGFASPEPYLIDADIRSNLLFGLAQTDITELEIHDALVIACAEFVYNLEGGLAHPLREHGDGISAGQKQRLALARCLLRRPEVLFLDEATANIDETTERSIFERLLKAYPDIMIVTVSHRSSLRNFATYIVPI